MAFSQVSGWEYLDKIVQMPFALPLAPPVTVRRFMASATDKGEVNYKAVLKKVQDLTFAAEEYEDDESGFVAFLFPERDSSMMKALTLDEVLGMDELLDARDPKASLLKVAGLLTDGTRQSASLEAFLPAKEFEEELSRWVGIRSDHWLLSHPITNRLADRTRLHPIPQ